MKNYDKEILNLESLTHSKHLGIPLAYPKVDFDGGHSASEHFLNRGWLANGNKKIIKRVLKENKINNFCELGSYLGRTAKFVLENRVEKNMKLYCVDIWDADFLFNFSPELHGKYMDAEVVDAYHSEEGYFTEGWEQIETCQFLKDAFSTRNMYNIFLRNMYEYKDNVIPLKTSTLYAIQFFFDRSIEIDAFYIDANHTYDSVKSEIDLIKKLHPKAIIIGDDYQWGEVSRAAHDCAELHSQELVAQGNCWMLA